PIDDAAVLDEQGVVPACIRALLPAVTVAVRRELHGSRRLQREAEPSLDFRAYEIDALVVHGVLEARARAVGAIPVIALYGHDRLRRMQQLLFGDIADDVGQARIGFGRAIGAPHSAADRDIEAEQLLVVGNRDEAQILAVNVDIVQRWNGEADLEFAR